MYTIFKKDGSEWIKNLLKRRILLLTACCYALESPKVKGWLKKFSSYDYDCNTLAEISIELFNLAQDKKVADYYLGNIDFLWERFYTRYPVNWSEMI